MSLEVILQDFLELRKRNKPRCDTNEEDCSHLVDQEFRSYGINNLGWSALFKAVVPDAVAFLMFWYQYNDNKAKKFKYCDADTDSDDCTFSKTDPIRKRRWFTQFKEWWKQNKFSQHNWAWFVVAIAFDWLWWPQFFLWLIWALFGWLPSWQKFYIEHIVSNFNWAVYGIGLWQMIVGVVDDSTWQSYLGLVLYILFAWMFSYGEWRLGTDAIRYLDHGYYWDPRLYPSFLYLFGIMDHVEKPDDFDYTADMGQDVVDERDIVIEDELEDEKKHDSSEEEFSENELEEEMWADETLFTSL